MKYNKILKTLGLLIFVMSPFLIAGRLLKIRQITCQSQYGPCSQKLEDSLIRISEKGENLVSAKREIREVLSNEVLVEDFSMQFKFPDRLEVDVLEKKPKYALRSAQSEMVVVVDKKGEVIYFQENTSLPTLEVTGQLPGVGEKVSKEELFALAIVEKMFSLYQIRTGKLEEDRLVIELDREIRVIFPLEGEKEKLVGALQLVLSRLKNGDEGSRIEGGQKVSTIDLRFKNPVLR